MCAKMRNAYSSGQFCYNLRGPQKPHLQSRCVSQLFSFFYLKLQIFTKTRLLGGEGRNALIHVFSNSCFPSSLIHVF